MCLSVLLQVFGVCNVSINMSLYKHMYVCKHVVIIYHQERTEKLKGGEILIKMKTFIKKRGGAKDRRPPPLYAYV